MIKKLISLPLFTIFFFHLINSQTQEKCGFEHKHDQLMQNIAFKELMENSEACIKQYRINPNKSSTIYNIPVVVHVLHKGEAVGTGTNISDAQINSAISHLNQVYRGQTANSPVDFGIQFSLAQQDPNCNASNGINRVDASGIPNYSSGGVDYFGDGGEADEDDLKDLSKWPVSDYFNIWIVSEIENNNGGAGVQGYANFFTGSNTYEGSMMMANVFGYDPTSANASFNLKFPRDNGTVIHEFGHYLHLHHTFKGDDDADQDGIGDNCPGDVTVGVDSDGCADTEVHKRHTSQCKTGQINDCTGAIFGNNVALNFMSYASCQDRLTNDQKTRARGMLSSSGLSLVYSLGDEAPNPVSGIVSAASCTPQTDATGLSGGYAGIMKMTILNTYSNITSNAQNDGGYLDFSNECLKTINLYEDSTYTFELETWFNDHNIRGFIDFNNDGDFLDPNEEILNLNIPGNPNPPYRSSGQAVYTLPSVNGTSILGGTKLRLRLNADIGIVLNPCEAPLHGQVEDYAIIINQVNAIPPVTNNIGANFCAGSSYNFNGTNLSYSGTYRDTIPAGAASGGDSIIVLTLNQHPEMSLNGISSNTTCSNGNDGTINLTITNGTGPYLFDWDNDGTGDSDDVEDLNNLVAGNYCVTVTDQNLCAKNNCFVVSSPAAITNTVSETVCNGGSFTYYGTTYNSSNLSGIHNLTTANGCDSTVTFTLTVNPPISGSENVTICNNYSWNGNTYNTTGSYNETLQAVNGCDSLATLNLTISNAINNTENVTTCNSYNFNGTILSASGTYKDTIVTLSGCDSIVTLNLTINPTINQTENITNCGDYSWNGNTYNISGTYHDTLQANNGCDSVVTLNLIINHSGASSQNITSCENYQWNGNVYNSSGTYRDTLQTSNGCDSVITLNLTVNDNVNNSENITSCGSYFWHNIVYSSSGVYIDTLQANNGCDSITTLNLTIISAINTAESATSCGSYFWHNNNYTATGSYDDTLQTINGCDSIITLNLTVNSIFNLSDTIESCDQYNWNNNSYLTSGYYSDSSLTIEGCDSISTLLLTINSSYSSTLTLAACNQFSWEGFNYLSSGVYQANYTTSQGCDSILYLDLTINTSFTDTTIQSECDQFSWNNQVYSISGVFVDSNLNSAGCDSLIYLDLSIFPSYVDTFFQSVCDSFVWNNNTYNTSGMYTDTLASIHSCDSVVTYDLLVNNQMGSPITLQLILDDYCRETRWTMKDSQDSIWFAGGPYDCVPNGGGNQANDTIIQDIYIDANECYTFELIDDFGDGMSASTYGGTDGEWLLTDYNGITLMQGQGNFGNSISADVYIISAIPSSLAHHTAPSIAVSVYPNPFINETQVAVHNQQNQFNYQILDSQGRIVLNGQANQNPFTLYNKNLSSGIYWLKILNVAKIAPKLLIIE